MKKSKKLSLQSLALVLMSFVLVAGVAFGMTGAWFTNKANTEESSVALGNGVKATLTGSFASECEDEHTTFMPGCTVAFSGKITADTDTSNFYARMKVVVTGVETGKIVLSAIEVDGETSVTVSAGNTVDTAEWAYLEQEFTSTSAVDYSANLEFVGAALDNTYIKAEVTVTVYLEIIQSAHTENTEDFWTTKGVDNGAIVAQVRNTITAGGQDA